jgi:hypothetical protein
VIAVAICSALVGVALGQSPDALRKAQAAFDAAQTAYVQGKYDDAAKGFEDAYAARPFPQFLYNVGASYHMKGKKTSDPAAYAKAVEYYQRYLKEDPDASDKAKVEKTIAVLQDEIKRLQTLATKPAGSGSGSSAAAGSGSGSGSAAPPAPAGPSQEVKDLGDVKVRGLVVIVTEPQNATVYLDDKKNGKFATTPWSGSIEGYKPVTTQISADPSKLVQVVSTLSEENYLGWIDVTSNVPKSDVFIDDKSVGAVGQTPWQQQIKPGKHTFWVSADGYTEYTETVDVAAGETHEIKAMLRGSPVGKLEIRGAGIEYASVELDGQVLCEHGPCLHSVPEGDHVLTIKRAGYRTYSNRIRIVAKTSTTVTASLQPSPGHGGTIATYVIAAAFAGGGVYLGLQANHLRDDLNRDIAAGMPPPDSNDPRIFRGKVFAISADAAYGVAGLVFLGAVYKTFHHTGPDSTASVDVRSIAIVPEVGSHFAGIGMTGSW